MEKTVNNHIYMNKNILQTYKNIKSIKIQGATNVAIAVGKALKRYARELNVKTKKDFNQKLKQAGLYLLSARATEPMADNVVEFVLYQLKKAKGADVKENKKIVQESVDYLLNLIEQNDKKIVKAGERLIKFGDKLFTHCHSSTVVKLLVSAKQNKKRLMKQGS